MDFMLQISVMYTNYNCTGKPKMRMNNKCSLKLYVHLIFGNFSGQALSLLILHFYQFCVFYFHA